MCDASFYVLKFDHPDYIDNIKAQRVQLETDGRPSASRSRVALTTCWREIASIGPFGGSALTVRRRSVVRANVVRASSVDGIVVNLDHVGHVTGTLLARNIALRAVNDDIDVEKRPTTLTRNVAVRNGDLGIEAVGRRYRRRWQLRLR